MKAGMQQDYRLLPIDQLEAIEKQTLRTIVQAIQEYSREAKEIFDNTYAAADSEVIVLAEDIVQYALEVAECYAINKRFAGFIDYKRVRWLTTPFGMFPQVLLVDAKASTENNRDTLQQSQLSMDAEFVAGRGSTAQAVAMAAGVPPHLEIRAHMNTTLVAVTTSAFIHFYYKALNRTDAPFRELRAFYVLMMPHGSLKPKYNPDPNTTFFGQGKHSPARGEVPRVRVYFDRFRRACPWRIQELHYTVGDQYTRPLWRDIDGSDATESAFHFIGR